MMYVVQILTAFLGSLGYALLYNVRGSQLLYGAAGGALGWSINLWLGLWLHNEIAQYLIAAVMVTIYAEICARLKKTPTTGFLITGIITLVPGSALYNTMSYAVNGRWEKFLYSGLYTVELAASLAVGIIAASSFFRIWLAVFDYFTHSAHFSGGRSAGREQKKDRSV